MKIDKITQIEAKQLSNQIIERQIENCNEFILGILIDIFAAIEDAAKKGQNSINFKFEKTIDYTNYNNDFAMMINYLKHVCGFDICYYNIFNVNVGRDIKSEISIRW